MCNIENISFEVLNKLPLKVRAFMMLPSYIKSAEELQLFKDKVKNEKCLQEQ